MLEDTDTIDAICVPDGNRVRNSISLRKESCRTFEAAYIGYQPVFKRSILDHNCDIEVTGRKVPRDECLNLKGERPRAITTVLTIKKDDGKINALHG